MLGYIPTTFAKEQIIRKLARGLKTFLVLRQRFTGMNLSDNFRLYADY